MTKITLKTSTRECVPDNYVLGYEGENEANKLVFSFADGFLDGVGHLNIKRGNDIGYLMLDKVKGTYQLPVKNSLLNQIGDVEFQFQLTKSDGSVFKYEKFIMVVNDSIDADTPIPDEYPNWIDTANAKLVQIETSISKAESISKQLLEDKANGIFNGKDGGVGPKGNDGYSPSATVKQTSEGATITIVDKQGTTVATVRNGFSVKGEDGKDGFSPSAKITQTLTGALIEITDEKGTTFAELYNGKDLTVSKIENIVTTLASNKVYRGIINENTTFVLPEVSDNTILNTIQIQVTISNYENITIDLGVTSYFGDIPELGNGSFILYYEFNGVNWCVGALPVVSEV